MRNIFCFVLACIACCQSYSMRLQEEGTLEKNIRIAEVSQILDHNSPLQREEEESVEQSMEIDINTPEYIVNELTNMGMPCTIRLYNEFGRHFRALTSTFFSKVEKIDNDTLNLMLVVADHTYNKDQIIGSSSAFQSSFGAKFWAIVDKISKYANKTGLLTTSFVSTLYLAFGGKCTFKPDNAACEYNRLDLSEAVNGITFYDVSKYLGPAAVFLYNLSDNICVKIMNYSSTKKNMYKSLDLGADYFYFIKDFANDGGTVDMLPVQYRYGNIDYTNIPQSFFNEYGPFFTKATRNLLRSDIDELSHDTRAAEYVKKAHEDDILEKTYKKIDTYQWVSGVLNPLSGLCSLLASTALILHTCVDDEKTKWLSQLCSVVLLPLSYILDFAAKKINAELNKETKNYMLYAYYQHTGGDD